MTTEQLLAASCCCDDQPSPTLWLKCPTAPDKAQESVCLPASVGKGANVVFVPSLDACYQNTGEPCEGQSAASSQAVPACDDPVCPIDDIGPPPCPDYECLVLPCSSSPPCPSSIAVSLDLITVDSDLNVRLGSQFPLSASVVIGGLVFSWNDFSFVGEGVGQSPIIVADCIGSSYEYINPNPQIDFGVPPPPDLVPICGSDAGLGNWTRAIGSMAEPDFPNLVGTNLAGIMTPSNLQVNQPGVPNPTLDGFYTSEMIKEVTRLTVSTSLQTTPDGCNYVQQTMVILIRMQARGRMTGLWTSQLIPVHGCTLLRLPITITLTRPLACPQFSPVCVPTSGIYGSGAAPPDVPPGVFATTQGLVEIGDGFSVPQNGPTLQGSFIGGEGGIPVGGNAVVF